MASSHTCYHTAAWCIPKRIQPAPAGARRPIACVQIILMCYVLYSRLCVFAEHDRHLRLRENECMNFWERLSEEQSKLVMPPTQGIAAATDNP